MQNPALNILLLLAVTLEEAVDELADFRANHFRHVLSEQDVKSGVTQIEAHGAEGIGKRIRFRDKNFGSWRAISADQHGRGPIAKENRRNQVGLGNISALDGKRRH